MFGLHQSQASGEIRESKSFKTCLVIGRLAHCLANYFYKAIVLGQFLLHLTLTLVKDSITSVDESLLNDVFEP